MTIFRRVCGIAMAGHVLGLAGVVFGASRHGDSTTQVVPEAMDGGGPAEIGRRRPALELDVLDGTVVSGARIAGHTLIVDFFATWCQPCHRALADLIAARQAAGSDIQLVVVDVGETPGIVRRWLAAAGLPDDAIVTLDPNGTAARRWGARRLPTTFIVDGSGVVRHINRGWGPGYRDRLSRWLRTMPAAASSPPSPHPPPR
jgi:cytochrome c biogenesis protein CcmG/thiol:disulfide interchange protein DsbE